MTVEAQLDTDPWFWARSVKALLAARHLVDITTVLDEWMKTLYQESNFAGCLGDFDPWDMLDAAAAADHPLATKMIERYVPMLLRSQSPDGGWDKKSLPAFEALVKHGLIGSLGKLPARTADWRVVRSVPAPKGDLHTMTWDGQRLWMLDREKAEAIAVYKSLAGPKQPKHVRLAATRGLLAAAGKK